MTKIIWDNLYTNLPDHIAKALRTARIKPEQLITKEDGELMAIEGITQDDVNSIRALYSAENPEAVAQATEDASIEEAVAEGAAPTKKALPPRKRSPKYKRMAKEVKKDELY